jgi:hypothetical protein
MTLPRQKEPSGKGCLPDATLKRFTTDPLRKQSRGWRFRLAKHGFYETTPCLSRLNEYVQGLDETDGVADQAHELSAFSSSVRVGEGHRSDMAKERGKGESAPMLLAAKGDESHSATGGAFFNMRPSAGQKHAIDQSICVFRSSLRPRRLAQGPVMLDHHRPDARTVAKGQA